MKTHHDPVADALDVRFADAEIIDSEEIAPGLVLDFDADCRIVGLEVLNARRHLAEGADLSTAAE